jgi:hypothetical protein
VLETTEADLATCLRSLHDFFKKEQNIILSVTNLGDTQIKAYASTCASFENLDSAVVDVLNRLSTAKSMEVENIEVEVAIFVTYTKLNKKGDTHPVITCSFGQEGQRT